MTRILSKIYGPIPNSNSYYDNVMFRKAPVQRTSHESAERALSAHHDFAAGRIGFEELHKRVAES